MKILSPLTHAKEVQLLAECGTDELYCGVLSDKWKNKFSNTFSINRRYKSCENMRNFKELKTSVRKAHDFNIPVFLTMNGLYSEEQYKHVLSEIEEAKACDVDGFIVADIGLLLLLKGQGLDLHLSTGGTVFNSEDVDFFRKLGVSKITLPRHMNLNEIRNIVQKNRDTEFDVFIMNTRCLNVDGFCTFQHGTDELKHGRIFRLLTNMAFGRLVVTLAENRKLIGLASMITSRSGILCGDSACNLNYKVSIIEGPRRQSVQNNISSIFGLNFWPSACGACALYDFKKIGISSLKIVGRENPTSKKVKDVNFLKKLLEYLNEKPSRADFYQKVKQEYKQIYKKSCNKKLCYYP